MKRYFVITGTVTYAIKGRDILRKMGYKAELKRTLNAGPNLGCGYGVVTNCDIDSIKEIFDKGLIKYLKIVGE